MSDHARDPSEDLAEWLTEVGRRAWCPVSPSGKGRSDAATETGEHLFRYLEELAGRELRSREDICRYLGVLSTQAQEAGRIHKRRRVVKDTVLLLCLLTAYIQYNFLDVSLQIARLPSTVIFVPVQAGSTPGRSGNHA